jgi:S1-C subfamily serine protease
MVRSRRGSGSGFLFLASNSRWYAWTDAHVVAGCDLVELVLPNRSVLPAEVLARGRPVGGVDVALLSLQDRPAGCLSVAFHSGQRPRVGGRVLVCGWPLGDFGGTVVPGEISNLGRSWEDQPQDICTAPTYPGNSGSPVVCRESGRVLGLVRGGAAGGLTLYTPTWRVRDWAREARVEWALDPSLPVTSPRDPEAHDQLMQILERER